MIIAIDGPAASGKGTLAKQIAAHYDYHHLDTGLLYRAVAQSMLEQDIALDNVMAAANIACELDASRLDPKILATNLIGKAASLVAVYPDVRSSVLAVQRTFAAQPPGAVLDGRDVGSFVCPEADVKLFVTASSDVRAQRRWQEEVGHDPSVNLSDIQSDIVARDKRDAERQTAPMVMAEDAHLLDTTNLSIDEAFGAAIEIIERSQNTG
jgi:cytidylate kinase